VEVAGKARHVFDDGIMVAEAVGQEVEDWIAKVTNS
jgi:hypothetical protein